MTMTAEQIAKLLNRIDGIRDEAEGIQNFASQIIASGKSSPPMLKALADLHIAIGGMLLAELEIVQLEEAER
ncbi:hypothetical protein HFO91_30325 [Rhizobium leguminosarum]|uniref:hypothetical protein n=1 Tax=Rhizobium leguminosarum TaxID=384 RepID=UPI001C95C8D3|nr:hypothetical protein [Rhizobium leguminosarum]MBY5453876.1 hypothetical protein [Rhizobium leguminosarum]